MLRDPKNPKHGNVAYRAVHTIERPHAFFFWTPEGLAEIPKVESFSVVRRWCAGCKDWVTVKGDLALAQADLVGCLECGKLLP